MHYYLFAINILVNDFKLKPDEAIKRLRLPPDTEKEVYKDIIEAKCRDLTYPYRVKSKKDYTAKLKFHG